MAVEADSFWGLVERRADETPAGVLAVDEHGGSLTAERLRAEAERVAAGLSQAGIGAGDVVSWQLPNRLSAIVLIAALARLGAVQNPLVPILREREVGFICAQAKTRLLVVPRVFRGFDHAAMAHAVAARTPGLAVLVVDDGLPSGDPAILAPPPVDADAVRWYFYTSGTTADPKGARHRDAGLRAAAGNVLRALGMKPEDRVAALAPIAHIGGVTSVINALQTGSTLIVSEVFDPEKTPPFLREQGVTLVGSGVPFIRAYLAYQRAHPEVAPLFPKARAFLSGGAGRPPTLHGQVLQELGSRGIVSGYGLTECPHTTWCSIEDDDDHLARTEGRPGQGAELSVVTAEGRLAVVGEEGELRVRAPQLMAGYIDQALNADAFDAEGRFRTGDLGRVDERGFVTISGRLKDVIIRNMENVSPQEVENLLINDPAVTDVAVVGLPDERTGERVCAVVVPADLRRPPTLEELCGRLLAAGLSARKLPETLHLTDELPRNAMGKVVKAKVRAGLLQGAIDG